MYNERQRAAYAKWLSQLGMTNPTEVDAVLDFVYTLATCAIDYVDNKLYEKEKRKIIKR